MTDLVKHVLRSLRWRWADERGAALMIAAGSMVALVSAVALAVDVGMLTVARTESQQVADGAALAGASALIESPDNADYATALAREYAGQNRIRRAVPDVRAEDVAVDLVNRRVTVTVRRTADRGNPVGTFFARIFGVNSVNITTDATAQASFAGGVNCLLPLTVPDRWFEAGGPGNDPDDYNPEFGDQYVPWMDTSTDPPTHNTETFTGYTEDDIGTQFTIKSNSANGGMNPSWYYPWRPPGQSGGDDYRTNINSCVDPSITYFIGQTVDTEPGNMVGPTKQGFQDLIAQDPHAVWNESLACVTDASAALSTEASSCRSSPRIRPVPMFDPREQPEPGSKPFQFSNFAGVFIEGIQGKNFIARWIGYRGLAPASVGGPTAGPQFKVLQLVE
ncbi:MAG: pilus assembly protein TadG-related protein [Gemmatimonadota bacterium]